MNRFACLVGLLSATAAFADPAPSCPSQQEAIVRLPPLPAFGVVAVIPEM